MIKWILILIVLSYSCQSFSGSIFECDLLNVWAINKHGDLEKPKLYSDVKGKFIIDRNTGIIEGDYISTWPNNLITVKVISYGDSNTNFKSIAIWEDQTQQITVETISFSGKDNQTSKPFTALSMGQIYTGLCKEGYR